jgi:hypothetical protein
MGWLDGNRRLVKILMGALERVELYKSQAIRNRTSIQYAAYYEDL